MIKITDIEALLNTPYDCDIDLWDVPVSIIHEIENLYMVESIKSDLIENTWITINSNTVTLTLNTMKKTKSESYSF